MPTNRNLNQRIRQALYMLKQHYGAGPVSIYTFQGTAVNLETGVKSVSKTVTIVQRAIILPARLTRELVQTISTISGNKQFVYGGTYDSRVRNFIIDRYDCPGLTIKDDDWLVFNGRKYEFKAIQEFEFGTAWVITAKELVGEVPEQIHLLAVDHLLDFESSAEGEL